MKNEELELRWASLLARSRELAAQNEALFRESVVLRAEWRRMVDNSRVQEVIEVREKDDA